LIWKAKETTLRKLFADHPEQRVPELALLGDDQWLFIARDSDLDSEAGNPHGAKRSAESGEEQFHAGLDACVGRVCESQRWTLAE